MNAQRLLAVFSKIGDDPDRIQQLRKIAVALAISGKLDNGAASMTPSRVLDAVNRVKAGLAKRGTVPKPKKMEEVTAEQLPADFSNPARFAPLGELARIEKGLTGIQQAQPGKYPLVVTSAERSTCHHFDFDGAAAIIPLVSSTGHGNASINRLHYQEGKFALGTILVAAFPYDPALISARFLFEYLSAFKTELLVSRMTGTANVTLSVGRVAEVPVPLICPDVQRKVDDLMALCDQLEQARVGREAVRDRLTAATWARLAAPETNAETFLTHARFALQTLPTLTTRPDQIKTLRQTILNLAVRGKLVEQDVADEPIVAYLAENPQLDAKTRRSLKSLPADECGGTLPPSWAWLRLGSIIRGMDAGWSPQCENFPRFSEDEWAVLRTTAVQQLRFDASENKRLPGKLSPRAQFEAEVGDILITRAGPKNRVGVSCVVDVPCPRLMISDKLIRFHAVGAISARYVALTLNAGYSLEQIEAAKSGMAVMQMNISQDKLRLVPIPLPPLAEQHRIVAKVDALMALCDQLEASLTTTTTTRSRLLEALLHEALGTTLATDAA